MAGILNGEMISGIAMVLMGLLFLLASALNPLWSQIDTASLLFIAIGAVAIGLGAWTYAYDKKHAIHSEHHH